MTTYSLILFTLLSFSFSLTASAKWQLKSLYQDGIKRSYWIFHPKDISGSVPLVIAYHGGGDKPKGMIRLTEIDKLATKEKFIAIFPKAYKKNWNDGRKATKIDSHKRNINDISFTKKIIAQAKYDFSIDPNKIYAYGFSNGALFAYRLACESPDLFSGFVIVGGLLPKPLLKTCRPKSYKPILIVAGDSDPILPYKGGPVSHKRSGRGDVLSAKLTMQLWSGLLNCTNSQTETTPLVDLNKNDDSTITLFKYHSCKANLSHLRINNGGHTWPGGPQYLPKFVIGPTNRDINATNWSWKWLQNTGSSK